MKKSILLFGAVFSCFLMVSMPLLPAVQRTSMENALQKSVSEEIQVITDKYEEKQELSSLFFKKIMQLQTGFQNDTIPSQGLDHINKGMFQGENTTDFLLIFLFILLFIFEIIYYLTLIVTPLIPFFSMRYIDTPHVDEDGPLTGGFDDVHDLTNFFDSVHQISEQGMFLILSLIIKIFYEIGKDTEEETDEFPVFFTIIQKILEIMLHSFYYGNPISILFTLFLFKRTLFLFKRKVSKQYNMMLDAFDVIDYDEDGY